VLVATATIRVVATEGQIYGRQLQQAGDYTGPHRDPLAGRYTPRRSLHFSGMARTLDKGGVLGMAKSSEAK